jgi:hypothetical protein
MKPMGEYYKELNDSYDPKITYELWKEYRASLCTWSKGVKGKKIAIIGAGNLNDINLNEWFSPTCEIHVFDADVQAMKKGVQRQNFKGIVNYHEVEFSGLEEKSFLEELSVLMAHQDITGIERFLKNTQVSPTWHKNLSFDTLIITPIYTQLLLGQVMDLTNHYKLEIHQDRILPALLDFIVVVIEQINKSLLQTLKVGARCFVWSDILEYHASHKDFEQIKTMSTDEIKALIDEYEHKYGLGMGSFGLLNMEDQLSKEGDDHYLVWPFSKDRLMLVKLVKGIKH